jgi:hypothetical protein
MKKTNPRPPRLTRLKIQPDVFDRLYISTVYQNPHGLYFWRGRETWKLKSSFHFELTQSVYQQVVRLSAQRRLNFASLSARCFAPVRERMREPQSSFIH